MWLRLLTCSLFFFIIIFYFATMSPEAIFCQKVEMDWNFLFFLSGGFSIKKNRIETKSINKTQEGLV